jgi:hypothetical protein
MWTCDDPDGKGQGSYRNGILLVTWDQSPDGGESWYLPVSAINPANPFAGKYQITEGGRKAFVLDLRADGRAMKSHAPQTRGAWLATADQVFVVWTDGWRDWLLKQDNGFEKRAFAPGSSFQDPPVNPGIARSIE